MDDLGINAEKHLRTDAILTLDHPHFRLVRELPCALIPAEHEIG